MAEHLKPLFATEGITFVQWVVLMHLRDEQRGMTAAKLCRMLKHDSGAFTRMSDHLEKRGFFERQRNKSDRREIRLMITGQGSAVAGQITPRAIECHNRMLAGLTRAEAVMLVDLLFRLVEIPTETVRVGEN
jgi:DNA-binding MarR family transcriptional regulator